MKFVEFVEKYSTTKTLFRNENLQNGDHYNNMQLRAEELLEECSGFKTIPANKHGPSCLDGFLECNGEFKVGYEIKTRNRTFQQLKRFGSFVITKAKVDNCSEVCKLLKIPFVAVCYSIPDDKIAYWFISDDRGKMTYPYRFQEDFVMNKMPIPVFHLPF